MQRKMETDTEHVEAGFTQGVYIGLMYEEPSMP